MEARPKDPLRPRPRHRAGHQPNTVQRALAALDDEGLTVPKRTAGRFVATDDSALRALRQEDARAATDAFIRACRSLASTLTVPTASSMSAGTRTCNPGGHTLMTTQPTGASATGPGLVEIVGLTKSYRSTPPCATTT